MRKWFPLLMSLVLLATLAACAKDTKKLQPFDPDASFKDANKEFDKGFYEEARRKFEELKRQDTTGEYAPLAQLRIADSYVKTDEPELAAEEYREFLDQYPRHKYATYAQYKVGMVYYSLVRGPERGYGAAVVALEAFMTLNERYPRNPYREEVELRIERCLDIIGGYEFLVGDFYFEREAYRGAIERLEGALRDYPEHIELDEVYFRLAISHKALGHDEDAGEYLTRLKREFPSSRLIKKTEKEFEDIMEQRAEALREGEAPDAEEEAEKQE